MKRVIVVLLVLIIASFSVAQENDGTSLPEDRWTFTENRSRAHGLMTRFLAANEIYDRRETTDGELFTAIDNFIIVADLIEDPRIKQTALIMARHTLDRYAENNTQWVDMFESKIQAVENEIE